MKHFLALSVLALLLSSCGASLIDVAVDNPTDEYVTLSIDSLELEIAPHEVAWVQMGKGNHEVTFGEDSTVTHNFTQSLYMINPTLSEYLMYEHVYGDDPAAMFGGMGGTMPSKTITFLGMEIEGQYDVVRDVVTPVTWDYGPREQLPEMLEVETTASYAYVKKLADVNEVLTDMMSAETVE